MMVQKKEPLPRPQLRVSDGLLERIRFHEGELEKLYKQYEKEMLEAARKVPGLVVKLKPGVRVGSARERMREKLKDFLK